MINDCFSAVFPIKVVRLLSLVLCLFGASVCLLGEGSATWPSLAEVPRPRAASLAAIEDESGPLSEERVFEFYRWNKFPGVLGHDATDHYFVANEFQAYLLQQPSRYAAAYFRDVDEAPPVFLSSERTLEGFPLSHYSLLAGGAAVEERS